MGPKSPPWFRPWSAGRSGGWLARPPPSRLEESPFWRRSACWQSAAKATPSSAPNAAMTAVSGCGGAWRGGEDRAAAAMVSGSVGCCVFFVGLFFCAHPSLRARTDVHLCTKKCTLLYCEHFFHFEKFVHNFLPILNFFDFIFSITIFAKQKTLQKFSSFIFISNTLRREERIEMCTGLWVPPKNLIRLIGDHSVGTH